VSPAVSPAEQLRIDLETQLLKTPETPPTKKRRTEHLTTPPEPIGLQRMDASMGSEPVVTAALQAALTHPEKPKSWILENLPVHPNRIVPGNFGLESTMRPTCGSLKCACQMQINGLSENKNSR
jgi:hypothetical protein